ncbi:aldehyde dehydrogenase (NADP(+)) [Microbacterium sp. NPDC055903]
MSADGAHDVESAAAAAAAAFPEAAAASDAERAQWLHVIADDLDGRAEELSEIADRETHLGAPRLIGEVARTTAQLRLFASVVTEGSYLEATIDHADPAATPPRPDLRRVLRPLGPVAVFAASNFPFAFSVAGGDTASALAVGCPVVVKIHPGHPELSRTVASAVRGALDRAGAPEGLLTTVEGFASGTELVRDHRITAVAFTGSTEGGRALFDLAAGRPDPIPFFGELGSVNPVVVMPTADRTRGAELAAGLVTSMTLGAGQFCTKPGVVLVPQGSRMEAAIQAPPGRPEMLSPSMRERFESGVDELVATAGVEVISGGEGEAIVLAVDETTVLTNPMLVHTEVFGPVTLLVRYGAEGPLASLGALQGSLTATLHADDADDTGRIVPALERIAGRILFEGWPTGVAVTWSQHHGGPWPSTTSQFTSVGATAVRRFLRPIAYQSADDRVLPAALQEDNPLGIPRRVDGILHIGERGSLAAHHGGVGDE